MKKAIIFLLFSLVAIFPAAAKAGEAKILVCPSAGSSTWPKETPSSSSSYLPNYPETQADNTNFAGVSSAKSQLGILSNSGSYTNSNWVSGTSIRARYPGVRLGSGPWSTNNDLIKGMKIGQPIGGGYRDSEGNSYANMVNNCSTSATDQKSLASANTLGVRLIGGSRALDLAANGNSINRTGIAISAPIDNFLSGPSSQLGFTNIQTEQDMYLPLFNNNPVSKGWQARSVLFSKGQPGEQYENDKALAACFGYFNLDSGGFAPSGSSSKGWCEDGDVFDYKGRSFANDWPGWSVTSNDTPCSFLDSGKSRWYDIDSDQPKNCGAGAAPRTLNSSKFDIPYKLEVKPREEFVSEIFCSVNVQNSRYCSYENAGVAKAGVRNFIATTKDSRNPFVNLGDRSILSVKNAQGDQEGIAHGTSPGRLSNQFGWINDKSRPDVTYSFKAMDKGLGVSSYSIFANNWPQTAYNPETQDYFVSESEQCTDWGYVGGESVQYRLDRSLEVAGTGTNSIPPDSVEAETSGYVAPHYTINHPPICPTAVDVNEAVDLNQTAFGSPIFKEGYNEAVVTIKDFSRKGTSSNLSTTKAPILIDTVAPQSALVTAISGARCYPSSDPELKCTESITISNQAKWIAGNGIELKGSAQDPVGQLTGSTSSGATYSSSGMAAGNFETKIGYKVSGTSEFVDSCLSLGDSRLKIIGSSTSGPDVGPDSNTYNCYRFPFSGEKTFNLPSSGTSINLAGDFEDMAGNINQYQSPSFIVDNQAPENTSKPTNTEGSVTLSASDNTGGSGVKKLYWRDYSPTNTASSPAWNEASSGTTISNISGLIETKATDNIENETTTLIINPKKPAVSLSCSGASQIGDWYKGNSIECNVTATRPAYSPLIQSISGTFSNGSSTAPADIAVSLSGQDYNQPSTITGTIPIRGEGITSLALTATGETGLLAETTQQVKVDTTPPVIDSFSLAPNISSSPTLSGSLSGGSYKGVARASSNSSDPFVTASVGPNRTDPWYIADTSNPQSRISRKNNYLSITNSLRSSFAQESSGANDSGGTYIVCSVELHSDQECQAKPNESEIELNSYLPSDSRWFVLNQANIIAEPGVCAGTSSGPDCIFDTSKTPFRPGDDYYIRYRSVDSAGNVSYSVGEKFKTTGSCALPALVAE